jgi:hypothetical protein
MLCKRGLRLGLLFTLVIICLSLFISQPVWQKGENNKIALANADNLKKQIITLSEELAQDKQRLNKSAAYIYSQFSQYSDTVNFQEYIVEGESYKNVVAEFSPHSKKCGVYVIGAHYDTYLGLSGADDNASGVAGLIELARLFSQVSVPCHLMLVAYTLEEPPYFGSDNMGSFIHAKSLKQKGINVELMISLEMIGYFSDLPDSQHYPLIGMEYLYSDKGNFISIVANTKQVILTRFYKNEMRKASSLPVYSINAPPLLKGIDFSDHLNYWHFGYPAIMITDTAFNRNENYHTKEDTAEKLDTIRMGKVIDGVYYATLAHMQNFD